MKIVVIGATGNIGSRVTQEALNRGHEIIGVVRDPDAVESPDPRVRLVKGDTTKADDVSRVVKGADAVVSAISPRPNRRGLPAPSLPANSRALIEGLRKAGVKRVALRRGREQSGGGPGQGAGRPAGLPRDLQGRSAQGCGSQLAVWRNEADGLDWTYLSPAAEIGPGERTGKYRTTGDQLLVDSAGKSVISLDYAAAVLDGLDHPRHVRQRSGWRTDGPALRPRPRADRRRRRRRAGAAQHARSRAARRAAGLPALLARRASQHAGHRERGDRGGDRPRGRRHLDDPRRRRRHHAAEPCAAGDRGAVRHAGVAVSRAHRPRPRPRAGHRTSSRPARCAATSHGRRRPFPRMSSS